MGGFSVTGENVWLKGLGIYYHKQDNPNLG
jgi:hypothetical protein